MPGSERVYMYTHIFYDIFHDLYGYSLELCDLALPNLAQSLYVNHANATSHLNETHMLWIQLRLLVYENMEEI